MRTFACFSFALLLAACGSSSNNTADGGHHDAAVQVDSSSPPDLAQPGDGSAPSACSPTDPMTDGQDCGKSACPSGTIAVAAGTGCKCLSTCTPGEDTECPCDRRCITLTSGDMGVVGGACLVGNGPGERCGADTQGKPIGNGVCAQGLTCAGASSGNAYCLWNCNQSATECPIETACVTITNQAQMTVGMACTYTAQAGGAATGMTCNPASLVCATGNLCDGTTCRVQCDGPGATCQGGTCTALTDPQKSGEIYGYVCK